MDLIKIIKLMDYIENFPSIEKFRSDKFQTHIRIKYKCTDVYDFILRDFYQCEDYEELYDDDTTDFHFIYRSILGKNFDFIQDELVLRYHDDGIIFSSTKNIMSLSKYFITLDIHRMIRKIKYYGIANSEHIIYLIKKVGETLGDHTLMNIDSYL